ncbi:unnamed protein product [Pleuronectes platessa]|uniref:Uncharacterized protein n=1 Tax=Pleuronectes platessa TaxID=8262 RepID=A0A9N7UWV4_PLEPL|nr:unnamed protein product [Pleuronectes platessa]
MDLECHESAEEKLAHQTSELELSGFEMLTEDLPGQAKKANSSPQQTHNKKASFVGAVKRGHGSSSKTVKSVYWFSKRYSYPALGRACLSLLLGCQDSPRPFSTSSFAADCLRRLAREAGCAETLKQDLLSLATAALS